MQEGIVVACDENQEWLLPWWWEHYSAHNGYPVLFVDFGMSEKGKAWCSERGVCVPLVKQLLEKPVSPENIRAWEAQITSIMTLRSAFFKKPFALLQSPFPLSLWLDLDCQVRGALDPLFYLLHFGVEFAVRKNEGKELNYSGGVIAFRNDSALLQAWRQAVIDRNDYYIHDEAALSELLRAGPASFMELPNIYNWNPLHGNNPQAVILHLQGGFLKGELRKSLAKQAKH
jgi:hypothetical protein